MVDTNILAKSLEKQGEDANFPFVVNPIPGEVEVLQIVIEDREELPIFISTSDEQILCISYLFAEGELKNDVLDKVNNEMLLANTAMPLSSFAKINDQYVLYGAMSVNSSAEDVVHEIQTLSDNTIDAIETMQNYLK
ncbi:MAG: DUF2170 family protein [Rickettsiales bacterium]|jgi:uncharacterized protein|nr:DUF2170 family protein [Rickettsiales bacterium]